MNTKNHNEIADPQYRNPDLRQTDQFLTQKSLFYLNQSRSLFEQMLQWLNMLSRDTHAQNNG